MTPEETLIRLDEAVSVVLEGFTGDERKRCERALNTIMTVLAIETIALRQTLNELTKIKGSEIAAAMRL